MPRGVGNGIRLDRICETTRFGLPGHGVGLARTGLPVGENTGINACEEDMRREEEIKRESVGRPRVSS